MKNSFVIVLCLCSWMLSSCKKEEEKPTLDYSVIQTTSDLTNALNVIYSESQAPGFAVSVIKNDVVVYQQPFGMADIEGNRIYTNQTTQPIGSISKTFVAAAVVKAMEQGYFSLETNINDILPVDLINPYNPDAEIKVKHLVTHTSGLLDQVDSYFQAYHILLGEDLSSEGAQLLLTGFGLEQRATVPLEEFLAAYYLNDGDLYSLENFAPYTPGSNWNYSNIATSLAAYIVETATGMDFKEYVSSTILNPLGMNKTSYDVADLNPEDVAKLYWDVNTAFPNYGNDSYPDGSIHTCNEDLAKFMMDMMKGLKGQSSTLFSEAGYAMLFEALLPDGMVPSFLGDNQGIFWFLDGDKIKHDGSDPGTTCNLQFDRSGEWGYFLLTNMDASTSIHDQAYFELAGKVDAAVSAFIQHQ